MSLLQALNTDSTVEEDVDTVGRSGPVETGALAVTVAMAYLDKSEGGALALNLHLAQKSGAEIRQRLWVTSGDKKGNLTYYTTGDGVKKNLPGFSLANSLCLLTLGKELQELGTEEKVINLYSHTAGKEVPTKVEVLVDLLDQEIVAGIFKQTVNKNAKDQSGAYVATAETREENEIDKFFRAKDLMTTAEIIGGAEEAAFINTWKKKWEGVTRDRTTQVSGSGPGSALGSKSAAPKKSLFA